MTESVLIITGLLVLCCALLMGRSRWSDYGQYLRSPAWKRKRKAALKRDGYRCRVCNRGQYLEVHHRRYPAVLGTESVNDLTTLCNSCHNYLTGAPWVPGSL